MSATIYWKPKSRGAALAVNSPSSFLEAMEALFGPGPWTLNATDLPAIAAAERLYPREGGWEDLRRAIESSGEIEVTVAY